MKAFSSVLSLLSIVAVATAANCPPRPASQKAKLAAFNGFMQKFYVDKNVTATFTDHFSVDFIEHNPDGLSGRQNAIDGLTPFMPDKNFTIINKGLVGDRAYVHWRMDAPNALPSAGIDIMRLNGSCFVEHWDIIQERPANPRNPLAMW